MWNHEIGCATLCWVPKNDMKTQKRVKMAAWRQPFFVFSCHWKVFFSQFKTKAKSFRRFRSKFEQPGVHDPGPPERLITLRKFGWILSGHFHAYLIFLKKKERQIVEEICKINKKIKKSVKNRASRAIFHTFFDFLVDFAYVENDVGGKNFFPSKKKIFPLFAFWKRRGWRDSDWWKSVSSVFGLVDCIK